MGSGTAADNIVDFLRYADGTIVGTSMKVDGQGENSVGPKRVAEYMESVERARASLRMR